MAEQQQQYMPGGHYKGANPVPTVKSSLRTLIKTNGKETRNWDEQSITLKKANQSERRSETSQGAAIGNQGHAKEGHGSDNWAGSCNKKCQ